MLGGAMPVDLEDVGSERFRFPVRLAGPAPCFSRFSRFPRFPRFLFCLSIKPKEHCP